MFLYQIKNETIAILGCRSYDGLVEIPETIDGKPVTELAAYAFSEGWGRREMLKAAGTILLADAEGKAKHGMEAGTETGTVEAEELPPVACCGHLKEIILPRTIKKIGNYAFYNCFELGTIRCWSAIEDVGSGLFTGCTSIRHMDIHIVLHRRSCLKEMISELRQELYVNYYVESEAPAKDPVLQAKLVFPEMFEESVENTPARIIMREMHGCGHMYRYCFDGGDFRFDEYDRLFPHVKVQEKPELAVRLALYRLYWPCGLRESAEYEYWDYVRTHAGEGAKGLIERGERDILGFMARSARLGEDEIKKMIEAAAGSGDAQSSALLLDVKHRRLSPAGRNGQGEEAKRCGRKRTFEL